MAFTSTLLKPKSTSLRLPGVLTKLQSMSLDGRSQFLSSAIDYFLSWDAYAHLKVNNPDSNVWLDTVEMGIDLKTRFTLSQPVNFVLSKEAQLSLAEAESLFIAARPEYQNKGVQSGIIRSALIQYEIDQGADLFNPMS